MISDFRGKSAFITGGAGGLGLAMARAFGRAGMSVALADIDAEAAGAAAEDLQRGQIRAVAIRCDVADRRAVAEAAAEAQAALGAIHLVCNNAGVAAGGDIGTVAPADWDWIIDVNLKSVVYGVETFAPLMLAHGEGGHIVNTASMAGMISPPGMEPYCATKFAVVAMSEGWAMQLAPSGVGMSVLCPGFVRTRIHESRRNRQDRYGEAAAQEDTERTRISAAAVLSGIDPDVVGERVVEGVRNGDFYIFTHPNFRAVVETRFAMIRAGFDAADASPVLKTVTDWPAVGSGPLLSPGGGE